MRRRPYWRDRRDRRRRRSNVPMVCLAGAFGFVCLCILSAKFLLFFLAVTLIALGLWLLICA
ncbi:MAG: hypothetical protein FWH20_03375 [Oscillospiraceae bacterium]|nr:hypothetical protein [Oscillospiraceae bacterium]